jgi:hypothetical protein
MMQQHNCRLGLDLHEEMAEIFEGVIDAMLLEHARKMRPAEGGPRDASRFLASAPGTEGSRPVGSLAARGKRCKSPRTA